MENTTFTDKLMLFGLSRQEAMLYTCLLQNGALTGYEVAKYTGISRSNVYNGLAGLAEQGAAYVEEGTASKYIAVPVNEFCENQIRLLTEEAGYLCANAPKRVEESEGYITIEGYRHICDKIHHMLTGATLRIYFSAKHTFLEKWVKEITELVQRRIKVVLISDKLPAIFEQDDTLRSHIIFYQSSADSYRGGTEEEWARQMRLIIDSEYVLTGEIYGRADDACLYSGQKNFVNVCKNAMHNEIELSILRKKMEENQLWQSKSEF